MLEPSLFAFVVSHILTCCWTHNMMLSCDSFSPLTLCACDLYKLNSMPEHFIYVAPLSVLLLDFPFVAVLLLLEERSKEEKRWKTRAEDRGARRGLTGFLRCGAAGYESLA